VAIVTPNEPEMFHLREKIRTDTDTDAIARPVPSLQIRNDPMTGRASKEKRSMGAQMHDGHWSGANQAVGFAQGEQRLLFVAVEESVAGKPRTIKAQVVDKHGEDDRFSGVAGGSVVSLVSKRGALLVGVLGEHDLSGSVVYPDGHAQTFAMELAHI
jgi:hypothetical protein